MSRGRRRLLFAAVLVIVGALLAGAGFFIIQATSAVRLTVAQPVAVDASDLSAPVEAANSASLVSDPVAPDRLAVAVRVDRPDFGCAVYTSADRGASWRRGEIALPAGAAGCYAPMLAFSSTGDLFMAFLGLAPGAGTTVGTFLARSTDAGASFGPAVEVAGPDTLQPRLLVDGRHVWVSWLDAGPLSQRPLLGLSVDRDNPLLLAHSSDGGVTFGAPLRVNPPTRPHAVGASLAERDGDVLISYIDLENDIGDYQGTGTVAYGGHVAIVLAELSGGAVHELSVAEPSLRLARVLPVYLPPTPALAIDASSGNVYVAYEQGTVSGGTIVLRRSLDGGRTWQPPQRLDSGAGTERRLPALGVVPGQRIDCAYYVVDSAANPAAGTVGFVTSTDGGGSFSTERDVLDAPFNVSAAPIEPRSGRPDLGDRLGLVTTSQWDMVALARSTASRDISHQLVASMVLEIRRGGFF
ncbi:MAG: hypothetical protein ACYDAC_12785 [Candidatus Dormibacteria bacterium]